MLTRGDNEAGSSKCNEYSSSGETVCKNISTQNTIQNIWLSDSQILSHQNPCFHHSNLSTELLNLKEPQSTGESVLYTVATDIVEKMLGESYDKELQNIRLADNAVGRSISDILEDLCY